MTPFSHGLRCWKKTELPGRNDIGLLRIRTIATKNQPCVALPYKDKDGKFDPNVILDF